MILSLRPLGFGAALAGSSPRGVWAFVVGNLRFDGFPAHLNNEMAVSDWIFREISGLAGETADRHKSNVSQYFAGNSERTAVCGPIAFPVVPQHLNRNSRRDSPHHGHLPSEL